MIQALTSSAGILKDGAIFGAIMGGIGIMFTSSMERENHMQQFFFLDRNDDIAQPLARLEHLLKIQGETGFIPVLSKQLNVIAGCDELTDDPAPFPLHLTYTINALAHHLNHTLKQVVDQRFLIPALGLEVCECVEQLTEAVENIKFNVLQETNLRVMNVA